jgi:hypothetical protein
LRACCSYHNIKIEPIQQQLSELIQIAYDNGKSIDWCQKTFRVGFKEVQKVVNRHKNPTFNPTIQQVKQWFIDQKTLKEISTEANVSIFKITKFFSEHNIKYDMSLLRDDIINCVNQGLREADIGRQFNITYTTVVKYLGIWGVHYTDQQKELFKCMDVQRRIQSSKKGLQVLTDTSISRLSEFVTQIRPLVLQEYSVKQISKKLGISQGTVKKVCDRFNIPYKTKGQLACDLSYKSFTKWVSSPREGYDYSLVTLEDWTSVDKKIPIICKTHGTFYQNWVNHFSLGTNCPKCANTGPSKPEQEVADYVRQLGVEVLQSNKTVLNMGTKEVDILIPSHNLAIEFNGLFWHSSAIVDDNIKHKHVEKTNKCEELGIQLLQINSDEWENPIKRSIWKSVIAIKLGKADKRVAARNTYVDWVDSITARLFLEHNHLQGPINGTHIGLVDVNKNLLMVLTYGKSRFEKNKIEILRLCAVQNTIVVGGVSKLLSVLRRQTDLPIVSYANRRWSNGKVYDMCGFKRIGITPPNYCYIKDGHTTMSRFQCQKHKLPLLLGDKFDSTKTEQANMLAAGFRIMFDCGHIKFVTR